MIASLQYYCLTINIEKVYRYMAKHQVLHDRNQRPSKKYIKYSRVYPNNPLALLDMDVGERSGTICIHFNFNRLFYQKSAVLGDCIFS